jgi:hypothetical protein
LATVGRTAAGRALDERAITAAAIAAIRHTHTRYDELLMSGFANASTPVTPFAKLSIEC